MVGSQTSKHLLQPKSSRECFALAFSAICPPFFRIGVIFRIRHDKNNPIRLCECLLDSLRVLLSGGSFVRLSDAERAVRQSVTMFLIVMWSLQKKLSSFIVVTNNQWPHLTKTNELTASWMVLGLYRTSCLFYLCFLSRLDSSAIKLMMSAKRESWQRMHHIGSLPALFTSETYNAGLKRSWFNWPLFSSKSSSWPHIFGQKKRPASRSFLKVANYSWIPFFFARSWMYEDQPRAVFSWPFWLANCTWR